MMNKSNQLLNWWNKSCKGDMASFGYIHQVLYPILFQYILRIIKDESICEDILQDLFMKMWERKESFGPIIHIKAYFFKAAKSMAVNYIRSFKNHDSLTDDHQHVDIVFSQEELVVSKENTRQINMVLSSALNSLPCRQREMIFLKYFDGWNYDQIAQVKGIKYQSVANHVYRGILQLRSELTNNMQLQSCLITV